MESTLTTITIKKHTLKLLKNQIKAEIFLDEEKIWTDHIDNHVNAEDKQKSFNEYATHCLSELSDKNNIEEFKKHIDSDDLSQILSSMGYALEFHFCSEGHLNEFKSMDATVNY